MSRDLRSALVAMFVGVAALASGVALGHGSDHPRTAQPPVQETAFGRTGDAKKVRRTVRVDMQDTMRFAPERIEVRQNDTVRFVVRNGGRMLHEMVFGTMDDLKAHYQAMQKHPGMEHDEPYMAHVAPGATATIVWQFTRPGEFFYGCLIPGHFESGMIGRVIVK